MGARGSLFTAASALALLTSGMAGGREPAADPCSPRVRHAAALSRDGIRAVVLDDSEMELAPLHELSTLGINTVVTGSAPRREIADRLGRAGLFYISYISSETALRLEADPVELAKISKVARLDSFAGFHYLDEGALEGYTAIAVQQKTHATVKRLFPDKLVLYPLRLDLVATEKSYLEKYFDARSTDLLTPYFYPVGVTPLGTFSAADNWEKILFALLSTVRGRLPSHQGVLPVLQAYEPVGFTVDEEFPQRQIEIYQRLWPDSRNAAAFAWGQTSSGEDLVGMAHVPALRRGFRSLFQRLGGRGGEGCRRALIEQFIGVPLRHSAGLPIHEVGSGSRLDLRFSDAAGAP